MSDDELKQMVQHLAKIHGVTPEHLVAEVAGEHFPLEDEGPEEDVVDAVDESTGDGEIPKVIPEVKKKGKIHWVSWSVSLVIVGCVLGVIIIIFMKFLNGPATAQATPLTATQGIPTPEPKAGNGQLSGLYITMQYPGVFDQVSRVKNDNSALEQYNITSSGNYREQISVDVSQLPSGGLNDDSSYRYRSINPDLYTPSKATLQGEPVVLMTKSDNTEQTLFWVHGGYELIIAITSSDVTDNVKAYMSAIMPTIRWKQ
jgi:hypothetical protein